MAFVDKAYKETFGKTYASKNASGKQFRWFWITLLVSFALLLPSMFAMGFFGKGALEGRFPLSWYEYAGIGLAFVVGLGLYIKLWRLVF